MFGCQRLCPGASWSAIDLPNFTLNLLFLAGLSCGAPPRTSYGQYRETWSLAPGGERG